MKHISYILLSLLLASCLSVPEIETPTVKGVKFYTLNDMEKYEEVLTPESGQSYTIGINSNADIVTVWPGGEREIMKKVGTEIDSIDINGNYILVKSNHYSDYGLLRAQGNKTSLNDEIGWAFIYDYPDAGEFELTVVATNHAYDSSDYEQKVFSYEVVIE